MKDKLLDFPFFDKKQIMEKPTIGTIGWIDLTGPNADELKDFYASVTGWKPEPEYCYNFRFTFHDVLSFCCFNDSNVWVESLISKKYR